MDNKIAQKMIEDIRGPAPDPDAPIEPRHIAAELIRRIMPKILAEERRNLATELLESIEYDTEGYDEFDLINHIMTELNRAKETG